MQAAHACAACAARLQRGTRRTARCRRAPRRTRAPGWCLATATRMWTSCWLRWGGWGGLELRCRAQLCLRRRVKHWVRQAGALLLTCLPPARLLPACFLPACSCASATLGSMSWGGWLGCCFGADSAACSSPVPARGSPPPSWHAEVLSVTPLQRHGRRHRRRPLAAGGPAGASARAAAARRGDQRHAAAVAQRPWAEDGAGDGARHALHLAGTRCGGGGRPAAGSAACWGVRWACCLATCAAPSPSTKPRSSSPASASAALPLSFPTLSSPPCSATWCPR